ncbi:homoserine O-acetyltransferase MetX [Thermoactinomyces mirandus]|uniref:Homoserine O-acetyltransferase n=1 Tax=Thermoactinomyces mirandus TaxID=2756294 RepID=A0A7W2ARL2_9BACL|nr:homoserine O-acetyltransferase [Thermoactinomyces mirandus]MBA4601700.1 homoserine O-acetyltransferase [Thermoactinomyces mirandus]
MNLQLIKIKDHVHLGPFQLECGEVLPEVTIAYEKVGNIETDQVILVCHALTGDTHAVGDEANPGWWDGLIGVGKYIDLQKYTVITMNVIGGCAGSTGPASIDPCTRKEYGSRFPMVTIRDMVRVQHEALRKLGIDRLKAVIGGSMGGMMVLEWAVMYPGYMEKCIPIATGATLSTMSMAYNEIGRQAILEDPEFRGGDYYPGKGPVKGLSIARMIGMVTYRTNPLFEQRFAQQNTQNTQALVESYLHYQGKKLVNRFDANTYLRFLDAMDHHDLGRGRGGLEEAVKNISAQVLTIGIKEDIYFPVRQQREFHQICQRAGIRSSYHEFSSDYGHDAFLVEYQLFGKQIQQFLDEEWNY